MSGRTMGRPTHFGHALSFALLVGASGALAGCDTQAYCFRDCDDDAGTGIGGAGTTGSMPSTGQFAQGSGQSGTGEGGGGGNGPCQLSNGGIEICDGLDNDCNGAVDDGLGIDFTDIKTCGTCNTDCRTQLVNHDPATITCDPGPNPGSVPGTCAGACAADYWDVDGDGLSCEYYCVKTGNTDTSCDARDDDCNNLVDDGVNVCNDTQNCGRCGRNCAVVHGTGACVSDGQMPCTEANTHCEIAACEPGWVDADQNLATGCEYNCTPTGVEICGDGIDNDCDLLIDGADDLSGDNQINQPCFGDPDGICAEAAHQGVTACVGNTVVCSGANVLREGDQLEVCDGTQRDEDCDGQIDENPSNAGAACGVSNQFPCRLGTQQCVNGALQCTGAINPGVESCNGQDDDCDGGIDLVGGVAPPDAMGACNVPVPPPAGATSPCMAGTKACVGGTVQCQGSVLPVNGATDGCNVDSNCDGQLTNQPNFATDPTHCGNCATNCLAGAVHANWSCQNSACHFDGCQAGFWDLDGNQTCEYACNFTQAQEICDGIDNDCDGQIDEGVVVPTPAQVCGVSPSASRPECTSGVAVACVAGDWQCTFPAGVCTNAAGCASTPETCDALDNDCDGFLNENVPNFGQTCASDAGLPFPGHGACRQTGTFQCNGPSSTVCSAVKADCATLPGGCTELCDGKDNDCDGSVDEPFTAKGTNVANFVRPNVTRLGGNLWIYQYEASRPTASNVTAGSGNGFFTSAPSGTTLDRTPSCSEPSRIPWFNVTPREVEQTCAAMGGSICSRANWQTSCTPNAACTLGYNPRGAAGSACNTAFTATKFCNLGPSFDFNTTLAGDQDGLLPTASNLLQNCWADWSSLQGNLAANNRLFDLTGNLREITLESANQYRVMGGAFNSQTEAGSACGFTFYTVNQDFKLYDTGFRCCFSTDPTM